MNKNILAIDLGTSSVKVLLRYENGEIEKTKVLYEETTPEGWMSAIKKAVSKFNLSRVDLIGLSSQVGTYIINDNYVISWDCDIGAEEVKKIKSLYSSELFIRETAMPHPDINSYPIPRLTYIKNNFEQIKTICQPKDYLIKRLTGNYVSDKYSWRGLAHTKTGVYSSYFLKQIGIEEKVLPKLLNLDDIAGVTTLNCYNNIGIPEGIPVCVGMNDFFSSVSGMDIFEEGEMFDITGTSEHIGVVCNDLAVDTKMVSGVYFDKYIHYGVTASSGASLDFGLNEFGFEGIEIDKMLKSKPPIFTPYLKGERAPIFDTDARGVFFGIDHQSTKKELAYSILEGVVFSLYSIYESIGSPEITRIKVSGGAAKNDLLNLLKADMFNVNVYQLKEDDTSALGAIKAAAGCAGSSINYNGVASETKPRGELRHLLMKRYNIYKKIYWALKPEFEEFSKI